LGHSWAQKCTERPAAFSDPVRPKIGRLDDLFGIAQGCKQVEIDRVRICTHCVPVRTIAHRCAQVHTAARSNPTTQNKNISPALRSLPGLGEALPTAARIALKGFRK
jgi:hypothetical protein